MADPRPQGDLLDPMRARPSLLASILGRGKARRPQLQVRRVVEHEGTRYILELPINLSHPQRVGIKGMRERSDFQSMWADWAIVTYSETLSLREEEEMGPATATTASPGSPSRRATPPSHRLLAYSNGRYAHARGHGGSSRRRSLPLRPARPQRPRRCRGPAAGAQRDPRWQDVPGRGRGARLHCHAQGLP